MSKQYTVRTNTHPTPSSSSRRCRRIVNVLFHQGDTLVIEQLELELDETVMSVLRSRGYRFDSYDDIEIEPVGRITY